MTKVVSPKRLCVYSNDDRPGTLNFLNMIETLVIKQSREATLDFSKVEFASAAATLLLFAIVNRAQLITSTPGRIRFKFPKKEGL